MIKHLIGGIEMATKIIKAETTKLESNKTILGTFTGKCCDAAVFNNNDMKLDRELFEKLIDSEEYKDAMEHRYYIGFLGHPEDPNCQDFKDACIVMTSMEIKSNDEIYGTFDLIDTPVGRVVKSFIDAGVEFGISIRGAGDVVGGVVDPDTFMFRGFDLVAFPAYPDSVPTFTAVAASTDPAQRKKYQKICAAVQADMNNITSCEAIDVLQSQFAPQSDVYKALENRKSEIKSSTTLNIDKQKIEAMTDMYLDSQAIIASQAKEIDRLKSELKSAVFANKRKTSAIERITASQMSDIKSSLERVTASRDSAQKRISSLTEQLKAAKNSNLIYRQRVEASQQRLDTKQQKLEAECQRKDNIIASLKSDIRKTVTANKMQERATSDLGADNRKLMQERDAIEANLQAYQDAYANIYASALGVCFNDLQISSATTVQELQDKIAGATNSANVCPSAAVDELYIDESNDEDLITL
jgi:hypothetical protein